MTVVERIQKLGLEVGDECEVLYAGSWCPVALTAIGRRCAIAYYSFSDEEIFLLRDGIRRVDKPVTLEEAIEAIRRDDGYELSSLVDRYRRVNLGGRT